MQSINNQILSHNQETVPLNAPAQASEFKSHSIKICEACKRPFDKNSAQQSTPISARSMEILTTDEFRNELTTLKNMLHKLFGDEWLRKIDECKNCLDSVVNDDSAVLRYEGKSGPIPLYVNDRCKAEKIKQLYQQVVCKLQETMKLDKASDCTKEKIEIIILLTRRYSSKKITAPFESLLSASRSNYGHFENSMLREIQNQKLMPLINDVHLNAIVFDLLLDGSIHKNCRFHNYIDSKMHVLGYGINLHDFDLDVMPRMHPESLNAQRLMALYTVLDFWDSTGGTYINFYTSAVMKAHGIDLKNNNSFIDYVVARSNDDHFERYLDTTRKNTTRFIEHINRCKQEEFFSSMQTTEKVFYILNRFLSDDVFSEYDCLLQFFYLNAKTILGASSFFVEELKKQPIHSPLNVEKAKDRVNTLLDDKINADILQKAKNEYDRLVENEKKQGEKELEGLKKQINNKRNIMIDLAAEATAAKLSTTIDIAKTLICPITFGVIKDAVITREGHTYDKESLELWLDTNPTCPLTRGPLSKDDLIPNRALQEIINNLHGETKKRKISTIE